MLLSSEDLWLECGFLSSGCLISMPTAENCFIFHFTTRSPIYSSELQLSSTFQDMLAGQTTKIPFHQRVQIFKLRLEPPTLSNHFVSKFHHHFINLVICTHILRKTNLTQMLCGMISPMTTIPKDEIMNATIPLVISSNRIEMAALTTTFMINIVHKR